MVSRPGYGDNGVEALHRAKRMGAYKMPAERTTQGRDVGVLDAAILVLCRPLDRLRRRCLRSLMPLIDGLSVHREHRVALTGCFIILASLVMSLMLPLWQLALGPILLGTLHILADFRYCVVRPGFHRRWPVVLCCGAPLLAMICGQGLDIGLLAVAFAFALAKGPLWKRITGLGAVSAAGMLVAEYGFYADVFFAHFHNVVAVLLWWAWRARIGKVHWAVLVMYLGVWLGLIGGAFDGVHFALASSGWGPEGQSMAYHAGFLGFGQTGMEAVRWVLAFAMAQSVHYWFWLRMVPEDDRRQYTPQVLFGLVECIAARHGNDLYVVHVIGRVRHRCMGGGGPTGSSESAIFELSVFTESWNWLRQRCFG